MRHRESWGPRAEIELIAAPTPLEFSEPRSESLLRISTRLAPIALLDSATDQPIRLGDLWQDRTVVLIFLRHFG